MNSKKIIGFVLLVLLFSSCKSTSMQQNIVERKWSQVADINDVKVYIDTASIKYVDNLAYSTEKKIFMTAASKKEYTNRIRKEYEQMGKAEKADKWNDFAYTIYQCVYDCANGRFYVAEVEDYDSTGKLIIKTKASKDTPPKWIHVDRDTLGDYSLFFVCDYE